MRALSVISTLVHLVAGAIAVGLGTAHTLAILRVHATRGLRAGGPGLVGNLIIGGVTILPGLAVLLTTWSLFRRRTVPPLIAAAVLLVAVTTVFLVTGTAGGGQGIALAATVDLVLLAVLRRRA